MQPLDVCFYGPLKTYFNQEISKWLRSNPGREVTHFKIAGLFNAAYGKAATVQNACHGFKHTGLWPVTPDIFPDYMYVPAETTDIPLADNSAAVNLETVNEDCTVTNTLEDTAANDTNHVDAAAVPIVSQAPIEEEPLIIDENPGPSSRPLAVSLNILSPAPSGKYITGQGKRKPKTRKTHLILTSTPNMEDIKARLAPKNPPEKKKKNIKKTLFDSDSDNEPIALNVQDDEDDCACIYCNDLYSRSRPGEGWLKCLNCSHWAHAECADLPKRTKRFICVLCV